MTPAREAAGINYRDCNYLTPPLLSPSCTYGHRDVIIILSCAHSSFTGFHIAEQGRASPFNYPVCIQQMLYFWRRASNLQFVWTKDIFWLEWLGRTTSSYVIVDVRWSAKISAAEEEHLASSPNWWRGSTYHRRWWWDCTRFRLALLSSRQKRWTVLVDEQRTSFYENSRKG